jgi:hypothetical protein
MALAPDRVQWRDFGIGGVKPSCFATELIITTIPFFI